MQDKFQHLAHIDIACVGRTVSAAAAGARLDTAYDSPVPGLLQSAALTHGHLHGGVIVEEARIGLALLNHLTALADQGFRCAAPDPHCQDGLCSLQFVGRVQAEVGQFIGRVSAVRGLAAYNQDLPHGIPRKRAGVPFIPHLKNLTALEVKALQQLQCLLPGESLVDEYVFFVERPHVLVKPAKAAGGGTDLNVEVHMDEPH